MEETTERGCNTAKSVEQAIAEFKATGTKHRLLLHACCAPCAASVVEYLEPFFALTIFFYNPNIMPNTEFIARLDALKALLLRYPTINLIVPKQQETDLTSAIIGLEALPEGGERCLVCQTIRLSKTAEYASTHTDDYDFFATTLTVSPHKNAELINRIGDKMAQETGVCYLDSNFKKHNGFLRSTQLTKEYGLYRQSYCGCIFD